ncbi:hypothetical protein C8J56DRAFT_175161 [Mycena floridula]|nr:hypothetical protein C8J56DRAFT_175161 [Mycena floridula]
MDAVSAIKEVITLGIEIQKSIEKVRCNKETTDRLSTEIALDLSELESLLDGYSFRDGYELAAAIDNVKREMMEVHQQCLKLIPKPDKTKVLSTTKIRFKAWRKRDEIETELNRLQNRVHRCISKFTAYSTARTERAAHRVEHNLIGHIVENRIQSQRIGGILETYLIGTAHGVQVVRQLAAIGCSDTSHKSIEYQYIHTLATRVVEMIDLSARRRGYNPNGAGRDAEFQLAYEAPDWVHSEIIVSYIVGESDPDNVVCGILGLLQDYKVFGDEIPSQRSAYSLGDLANRLGTFRTLVAEADELRYWAIKLYRSLARGEPSFFPFLAHQLSNSFVELATQTEAYHICTMIHDTLPDLHSPWLYLRVIKQYLPHLISQEQFEEALPIAQTAVDICRSLWVLPIAPMDEWKHSDPRSDEVNKYIDDAYTICSVFLTLSLCFTQTGNLDAAYSTAKECPENFIQLPPIGFRTPEDYSLVYSLAKQADDTFCMLSQRLREADRLDDAYDILVPIASYDRTTPSRYSYSRAVEAFKLLHHMHTKKSLRFSHVESLIHAFHASDMLDLCMETIETYAMLCLQCEKDDSTVDLITVNDTEMWDDIVLNRWKDSEDDRPWDKPFPDLTWSQLADFAPQFWAFISADFDVVWDCLYFEDSVPSANIISLSFAFNYERSVAAMTSRLQPDWTGLELMKALEVVLELMKKASIPFESSMVNEVVTACTKAIETFDHDNVPGWPMISYCSILDNCGLVQEALDTAYELTVSQNNDWIRRSAHEFRVRLFKRNKLYNEAVSAARDLVAVWQKIPEVDFVRGYAADLDLLSACLIEVGDTDEAAKVRAKADLFWPKGRPGMGLDVLQASITEVVTPDPDIAREPPLIMKGSERDDAVSADSFEKSSLNTVSSPVVRLPKADTLVESPTIADRAGLVLSAEPIMILKVTNVTLIWGLAYLVALAAILMAIRK